MSFQIVRKKLTPDEISPPYLRYNGDCDCVQTTPDGGVTWTDTPGQDPRIAPGFLKPPNSSEDPRCNAAANMVAALRSFIALDISATSTWGLASGFAAIYILIFPVGVLIDLLIIIAGIIVGIGAVAIDEAFTEDVYDGLLCIFNDNIDADGQMSDAQLADIYTAVASQFGGVVETVFGAHSSGLGANGWSNIGATGTETGDCDSCAGWCLEINFAVSDGDAYIIETGVWESGLGWRVAEWQPPPGDLVDLYIGLMFNSSVHVTKYQLWWTKTDGGGADNVLNSRLYDGGSLVVNNDFYGSDTIGTDKTALWEGDWTADEARIGMNCGTTGGDGWIYRMRLVGDGDPPVITGFEDC